MSWALSNTTSSAGSNYIAPPGWLDRPFAASSTREVEIGKLCIKIVSRAHASLLLVTIPAAGLLRDDAFRDAVSGCYRGVGELVLSQLMPVKLPQDFSFLQAI